MCTPQGYLIFVLINRNGFVLWRFSGTLVGLERLWPEGFGCCSAISVQIAFVILPVDALLDLCPAYLGGLDVHLQAPLNCKWLLYWMVFKLVSTNSRCETEMEYQGISWPRIASPCFPTKQYGSGTIYCVIAVIGHLSSVAIGLLSLCWCFFSLGTPFFSLHNSYSILTHEHLRRSWTQPCRSWVFVAARCEQRRDAFVKHVAKQSGCWGFGKRTWTLE